MRAARNFLERRSSGLLFWLAIAIFVLIIARTIGLERFAIGIWRMIWA